MAITVILDTNILLNAKNGSEPHSAESAHILDEVEKGSIKAIISVISVAELCAGYYSQGDMGGKEELLAHLISSNGFLVADVDLKVADSAAGIRNATGLRLPDALIVATGLANGANYVVTHDLELKKASGYLEAVTSKEMIGRIKG